MSIPLPSGLSPAEFDPDCADRVVRAVVVRKKEVTLWWAKGDSVLRQRLEALALALYTGTKRAVRIYVPMRAKVSVGEVIRVTCSVRELSGRPALWTDTVEVLTPDENERVVV